jgi:hypothetical protein
LRELLGGVRVADAALAVQVEAGVVAAIELVECGLVAPLIPQYERAVTIQVNRTWILNLLCP